MFQFHTGSIKRESDTEAHRWVEQSFNSILVRLKAGGETNRKRVTEFQFHTGSIKRQMTLYGWFRKWQFQFHTGSIKSLMFMATQGNVKRFNSILVRLKDRLLTAGYKCRNKFQFHTGSIKR